MNNQPLYCQHFIDRGILQIGDLVNEHYEFKSFQDIVTEFGVSGSFCLYYSGIIGSVSKEWKSLIKNQTQFRKRNVIEIVIGEEEYDFVRMSAKELYNQIIKSKCTVSQANVNYSNQFAINSESWAKIYVLPRNIKVKNKTKELHYKILHNYVACNKLLYKIKVICSPRCNFCNLYTQDCQHLFFECLNVKNFWLKVENWFLDNFQIYIKLNIEMVLFGLYDNKSTDYDCELVNQVLMVGKLYIFNCKLNEKDLNIDYFNIFWSRQ